MGNEAVPEPRKTAAPGSDDGVAEQLRGFGPIGLFALLLILGGNLVLVPLSAVLVLIWARLSHTPWQALGFVAPRSWARILTLGIPLGIGFKLGMKAIVMPLFGAPALNPRYHYLVGNTDALPWTLYAVIVGAGFGEETLFRGFFFERLRRIFGRGRLAHVTIVGVTSGLFALAHYQDQGVPGVEQAAITGLVFGSIYAITGQIWIPMAAHAAFDVTAVALIYWNWESKVAHLLFR